jgi:hypothetical protein
MALGVRDNSLTYLEADNMAIPVALQSEIPDKSRHSEVCYTRLLVAVDYSAAVEVIRAELNRDAVAGEDTDEVFAHASGDVCEGLMLVFKLDLEQRIGQCLDDNRHYFNCIFLRQTLSFAEWERC